MELLLNQLMQPLSLAAKLSSVPEREAFRTKGTGKRRAVIPGVTKIKMTMYRTTTARGRNLPWLNRYMGNARFLRAVKNEMLVMSTSLWMIHFWATLAAAFEKRKAVTKLITLLMDVTKNETSCGWSFATLATWYCIGMPCNAKTAPKKIHGHIVMMVVMSRYMMKVLL